ncbi:MAG: HAD family hydrolase [Ruminiclostridium sp.]|nr:HAD family hydrolase [Ruminiclostridium sp.]
MIKMIITDLDNTLLRSDKSISEYTISTLMKYQDKGIKVGFATARSKQSSSRFLNQFTPDIFIGYGGAISFAGEEVISRFDIPADISSQLINKCLQEPDILYVHATNESVAYTNRVDTSDADLSHYKYVDFSLNDNISYLKISIVASNPHVVERIASNFPMLDLLRYTGENLYRFANRNAVKWNAVKAVAEYYNINTDMVVAFGDDINDLEMIKNCGVGVAVKNGIEEVKSVAKFICDISDNDGVAKWLEERIL